MVPTDDGRERAKMGGQRVTKLQQAFHVTVKYALRGSPADEFEAYFPEGSLPKEVIEVAYDAYVQVRLMVW